MPTDDHKRKYFDAVSKLYRRMVDEQIALRKNAEPLARMLVNTCQPQRNTKRFEVYNFPENHQLKRYALLLFKEGEIFTPETKPDTFLETVRIGGRLGCFMLKQDAQNYNI
jgi:hypothetical protein